MGLTKCYAIVHGCRVKREFEESRERRCKHPEFASKHCPECGQTMWSLSSKEVRSDLWELVDGEWHSIYRKGVDSWNRVDSYDENNIFVGRIIFEVSDDDHDFRRVDFSLPSIDRLGLLREHLEEDGFKVLECGTFIVPYCV